MAPATAAPAPAPAPAEPNGAATATTATTSSSSGSTSTSNNAALHTCCAPGCSNPAKLQCPTCLKLHIPQALPQSYFCSQTCFKGAWTEHKILHHLPLNESKEYTPWPFFKFTGPLRPWPVTPRRTVPPHIQKPDYADTGVPRSELQDRGSPMRVLTPEQIEKMRTVCRLGREILDIGAAAIRPGVTTEEIDRIVHEATIARNAYPSPLNYNGFPKSCCTSVNEVICHGIPDLRPLQEGDIVNLDISVYYDGFHSDLNETFYVGAVSERAQKLVNVARECLEKAIAMVKPGTPYRDLGNVIQKHADANGFSVVRTFCGHGVHWLFHTTPNIPHYAKNKATGVMKPGHVFTIEPMINEGTYEDEQWPDDWTAVTADGKLSAQFEHTLLVTETGVEILTAASGSDSSFISTSMNAKTLAEAAAAKAAKASP